jgi:arginine utilization protein RocB
VTAALTNRSEATDAATTAITLVGWPSVTGTAGERAFAEALYVLLSAEPYFQAHPADIWLQPIANDPGGRSNLWALVRGDGADTVVLTGHYDVVGTTNYGRHESLAFDPLALRRALIADLASSASSAQERLALEDFRSGAFLPGRGALDMKSGLAAGITALRRFAAQADRRGNLLLIATPDEENSSVGMRAAAAELVRWPAATGRELVAAINLDATSDHGDGRDGQAIYLGSVGKVLLTTYVVGRDAHAGYPFEGISASRLAAEIVRRLDCETALADEAHGEVAPPPAVLELRDTRTHYDVTLPAAIWCAINVLQHQRTAEQLLAVARGLVRDAVGEALDEITRRSAAWHALSEQPFDEGQPEPLVLTFAELEARVWSATDGERERYVAFVNDVAAQNLEMPTTARLVTEWLWQESGLRGPAVILGFGSVPYPAVHLDDGPRSAPARAAVEAAIRFAADTYGAALRTRQYFAGISDMSFLGGGDTEDLKLVAVNTPAWHARIRWDISAAALHVPVINIGPWGRDYHQRLERVNSRYAFEVLPAVVGQLIEHLLRSNRA